MVVRTNQTNQDFFPIYGSLKSVGRQRPGITESCSGEIYSRDGREQFVGGLYVSDSLAAAATAEKGTKILQQIIGDSEAGVSN